MSDNVLVPMGGDNAQALLDAAGDEPEQVRVVSGSGQGLVFEVPKALAKKAGVDHEDQEDDFDARLKADEERLASYNEANEPVADLTGDEEPKGSEPPKTTAKKTAAKKSANK